MLYETGFLTAEVQRKRIQETVTEQLYYDLASRRLYVVVYSPPF
jgi:hypothetical protein